MQHKMCTRCGMTRPLKDFYINQHRPGGRRNACKDCESVRYMNADNRWRSRMLRGWLLT